MMSIINISKTVKIIVAICIVMIFALFAANYAHAASGCVTGQWISNAGNGATSAVTVANRAGCGAKQVSLCSYRVYIRPSNAGWLSTQTLFDSKVITLQPGQTATMSVKTDDCMNQVDAYEGPCVNPFPNDNTNVPNIFMGKMTDYTQLLCKKCTDECTEGQKVCDGNGWKICIVGPDTCTIWSGKTMCEQNQICAGGSCVNTCQPSTCDMLHYKCGVFSDGCGGTLNCGTCEADQTCQNGNCVANCQDQCQLGDRRCSGNGYQVCGKYDGNGCTSWGQTVNCDNYQFCENGYCNRQKQNLNVNLYAESGCAPLRDVTLRATVNSDYGHNYGYDQPELTYRFDCGNGGSKVVTTTDTEVIVKNLCDYENVGDYIARVRVESDGVWAQDSTTVEARNCQHYEPVIVPIIPAQNIQIQKTVADLSNGTNYQPAVTASPSDVVSFRIVVGSNTGCQNVIVSDIIPAGVGDIRDLRIDGQPVLGDILAGIPIAGLAGGQQRVITFTATVAGPAYFPFGQTTLTDTATARNNVVSNSSSASVYVWRQAVLGATHVSTGITDSPWFEYLAAVLMGLIALALIFRNEIGRFRLKAPANRLKTINPAHSAAELKKVIASLCAASK